MHQKFYTEVLWNYVLFVGATVRGLTNFCSFVQTLFCG